VATSATTLVQRVRRFLGDWPELDSAAASISSGGTSLTVATDATTRYAQNWLIQVDQEMMGRMLNFGTILLSGVGSTIDPMPNIADPLVFRRKFMEATDRPMTRQQ